MGDNLLMFRENQDLEAHSLSRKVNRKLLSLALRDDK